MYDYIIILLLVTYLFKEIQRLKKEKGRYKSWELRKYFFFQWGGGVVMENYLTNQYSNQTLPTIIEVDIYRGRVRSNNLSYFV